MTVWCPWRLKLHQGTWVCGVSFSSKRWLLSIGILGRYLNPRETQMMRYSLTPFVNPVNMQTKLHFCCLTVRLFLIWLYIYILSMTSIWGQLFFSFFLLIPNIPFLLATKVHQFLSPIFFALDTAFLISFRMLLLWVPEELPIVTIHRRIQDKWNGPTVVCFFSWLTVNNS